MNILGIVKIIAIIGGICFTTAITLIMLLLVVIPLIKAVGVHVNEKSLLVRFFAVLLSYLFKVVFVMLLLFMFWGILQVFNSTLAYLLGLIAT